MYLYDTISPWVLGGKDGPVQHGGGGGGSSKGGGSSGGGDGGGGMRIIWMLMFLACLLFMIFALGDAKGVRF